VPAKINGASKTLIESVNLIMRVVKSPRRHCRDVTHGANAIPPGVMTFALCLAWNFRELPKLGYPTGSDPAVQAGLISSAIVES
jgi:hypothetical protein